MLLELLGFWGDCRAPFKAFAPSHRLFVSPSLRLEPGSIWSTHWCWLFDHILHSHITFYPMLFPIKNKDCKMYIYRMKKKKKNPKPVSTIFWLSRLELFQLASESGPCGGLRHPVVSNSIRSNGGPFCSQLIERPVRPGAYRLVEILPQPSGSWLDVTFFPVTHVCRNGTTALLAIPQRCEYAWACVSPLPQASLIS